MTDWMYPQSLTFDHSHHGDNWVKTLFDLPFHFFALLSLNRKLFELGDSLRLEGSRGILLIRCYLHVSVCLIFLFQVEEVIDFLALQGYMAFENIFVY
jgi:hypothetical protein